MDTFEIDNNMHNIGDVACPQCWGYHDPKPCECGGLIHTEFGDEDGDCNYWLYYKCDKCGSTEGD